MKTTLIKNGSVVLPDGVKKLDVLIDNDVISQIGEKFTIKADRVIEAGGKHVFAGFIDLHCHLREPGQTHKEDIASGAAAAVAGGFTTVCCMPNTNPVIDNAPLVEFVKMRGLAAAKAKVLPIGAITKGQSGEELAEMGRMCEAGAVAFSDDGHPVSNSGLFKLALEYADSFGALVISHSEDKTLSQDGSVNEGYHASKSGLKPIPRAAEEVGIARDMILAETTGTRIHIAHVSTRGSVQLIREAKKRGVRVTCETCPHYFAATDSEILSYNTNAKINPPLRTEDDRLAIIEGIVDGTIDAIATDHAPHSADEKNREFDLAPFGTSGFETAFSAAVTYLVKPGYIALDALSRLLSAAPAAILGIAGGKIEVGMPADLAIADLEKPVVIDAARFVSKGKNSVFDGWNMQGKIVQVLVNGEQKL